MFLQILLSPFYIRDHYVRLVVVRIWVVPDLLGTVFESFGFYIGLHWSIRQKIYRKIKEYKVSSAIHNHYNTTGHDISIDNSSIVGREDQNFARSIKEPIVIRVNDPSLNRYIGKYQLSHIWDERCWWIQQNSSLSKLPYNILDLLWYNTCHIHAGSLTPWTTTKQNQPLVKLLILLYN